MYDGGLQRCKYLKTNKKNKKNQSNFEAREIFKKNCCLTLMEMSTEILHSCETLRIYCPLLLKWYPHTHLTHLAFSVLLYGEMTY